MALQARLTVTSEQGQSLGRNGSHEFGAAGGVIGRSPSCDWCLPDPTHTLSGRHAEIRFNGQGFVVVDLSTNGVYVNSTDAPIGRGNTAVLVNGDQIYIGTYVISVEILRQPKAAAPVVPLPASPQPNSPQPISPLPPPLTSFASKNPTSFTTMRGGGFQATLDPIAALDGDDALQETDNPFGDLGIGHRDREKTDSGLRSLNTRPPSSPMIPSGGFPPLGARPAEPPPVPSSPSPPGGTSASTPIIPPDFALTPPPPPVAAPPPRREAPPLTNRSAPQQPTVIPPNFLEELSQLIPQLGGSGGQAPAADAAAPQAPVPQAPTPQASIPSPLSALPVDDPEDMVTLLRRRARAKTATEAPTPPAPAQAAPALPQAQSTVPPVSMPPAPAPRALVPEVAPHAVEPQAAPVENSEGAFWALFGVDGARLAPAERSRLLGEAAGLMRELVDGVIALQATRRSLKGELHLEATLLAGDENPFKTATSAPDALTRALRGTGRVGAGAAARAIFEEMRIHEMAALDAMQATIARLMQRISPAAIAFELEGEGPSEGVFARKTDKARLWDRYLVMHERLVDALDVVSPELVGQEFARAYAQHAQTLKGGGA